MATYHSFSDEAITQALETARRAHDTSGMLEMDSKSSMPDTGEMSVLAECIAVTVEDGKICLSLPLGIGKICIPIPVKFPDGTAAQACLSICHTGPFPTGVKVTVSIAGVTIITKTFGKC